MDTVEHTTVPTLESLAAENAQLRAENTQLRTENAQLRADLAETRALVAEIQAQQQALRRTLTDLQRRPFARRRPPPDPANPAPRGRPAGHPGSSRPRPTQVDRTERIAAGETCPDCGTAFTGQGVERDRIVEEIQIVRPTITTRFIIQRRWCPHCRVYHEAPVTAALPHGRLGLSVLLFVVYQKVALGLSYGMIQEELRRYFGLTVSHGALPRMVAEVARLFGPAYAQLIALMRRQQAVHVDETSWKVNGTTHWLWTFLNDIVAVYVVSRSRGSRVPKALLGPDFEGTLISDFYSAYSPLDVDKAKCWSHLLRETRTVAKAQPADSEPRQLHTALHEQFLAMGLALEAAAADPDQRAALAETQRAELLALARRPWRNWDCQRIANRIETHVDALLVWLLNPAVDATNNAAERGLRGAVVARKIAFGSRSKYGAQAFARLLSLIETWERQDQDFFDTAHAALTDYCSQR